MSTMNKILVLLLAPLQRLCFAAINAALVSPQTGHGSLTFRIGASHPAPTSDSSCTYALGALSQVIVMVSNRTDVCVVAPKNDVPVGTTFLVVNETGRPIAIDVAGHRMLHAHSQAILRKATATKWCVFAHGLS